MLPLIPSYCNLHRLQIPFNDSLPIAFLTQRIIQYGGEKERKHVHFMQETTLILCRNTADEQPSFAQSATKADLSMERNNDHFTQEKRSFYAGALLMKNRRKRKTLILRRGNVHFMQEYC